MKRTSLTDRVMTREPQQHTLSIRVSDTLRLRLERVKQLMMSTTGKQVSRSAIAKQFLESAREERLEVVELLAHLTDTLLQIRREGDARQLLSRAEWTVLAHFAARYRGVFRPDAQSCVVRLAARPSWTRSARCMPCGRNGRPSATRGTWATYPRNVARRQRRVQADSAL